MVIHRLIVAAAVLVACRPEAGSTLGDGADPPPEGGAPDSAQPVDVPRKTVAATCTSNCLYVDAALGRDDADGRSPSSAWRTLNRAAAAVQPGSTVMVMGGTYTSDGNEEPLLIRTSGRPDAWITFASAPGQHPVIGIPRGPGGWSGIHLVGVAYIVIDGFEVIGQNRSITPSEASSNDGTQAVLNEIGIYIDGVGTPQDRPPVPHDIVIRNNDVHDCSAGGVAANVADALTIAYNRVHDNAWWTVSGMSGLGVYHMTDARASITTGGYRNLIVGNDVFDNYNNLPWIGASKPGIYDGNGIVFDDGNHTQPAIALSDVRGIPYTGRTYVANNLSHGNGGRGIHVYASAHVDVVNNTTYDNLKSASPHIEYGEIDAQSSSDVNILNNVSINLSGKAVTHDDRVLYDFNIWDGRDVPVHGVHDLLEDPELVDPAGGDFSPRSGSPALGSGTGYRAPTLDVNGNQRPMRAIDRGAVQVTQ